MSSQINLLPLSCYRSMETRLQLWRWAVVLIFCVATLNLVQNHVHRQLSGVENELALLRRDVQPLELANQQIAVAQAEVAEIRAVLRTAENLEQADVPLALIQVVADCCHLLNSKIQLTSLKLAESSSAEKPGNVLNGKEVLLTGKSMSDSDISALIGSLSASGVFREVALQSAQAQSERLEAYRSFQIKCVQ